MTVTQSSAHYTPQIKFGNLNLYYNYNNISMFTLLTNNVIYSIDQ